MKKVLSLILCLMLMLPLCASAETATEEWVTVDLGDFTMNMLATDLLQSGTKAENQVMFIAYPRYDERNTTHATLNAVWTSNPMLGIDAASSDELNLFTNMVIAGVTASLEQQGVAITNAQIMTAEYEAESGSLLLYYSVDCDYSGLGIDMQITLYQMQIYLILGDAGTYCFTLAAAEEAQILDMLENYFSTVTFK